MALIPSDNFILLLPKLNHDILITSYKHGKLKLKVFLTGHTIAMVTTNVQKIIMSYRPMIGTSRQRSSQYER